MYLVQISVGKRNFILKENFHLKGGELQLRMTSAKEVETSARRNYPSPLPTYSMKPCNCGIGTYVYKCVLEQSDGYGCNMFDDHRYKLENNSL